MRICDSWCDHVECNAIRKKCMHLIEHRQFIDWSIKNKHELIVHGKCLDCLLYVPFRIKRIQYMQNIANVLENQSSKRGRNQID